MDAETLTTRLGDPSQTLYLVDISSFIFRAFFAIRSLTTHDGEPVNAVYGVATMMAKLAEEASPEFLAVVYDSKGPSFREEIYPEYKANRSEPPPDLVPQFARIEELIKCFEMHSYRQSGIEADDLIASLTHQWIAASPEHRVVIVSSDKDLMQLVTGRVSVWDTMSNKVYGPAEVEEKFQVKPSQIRDYLGLVGDSSDNIPGVAGVGPKTAADLLREFGDLDSVLKAAKAGKISGKKGETLKASEDDARLSAKLATVLCDLKVDLTPDHVKYKFHVTRGCSDFLKKLNFNTLVAKWAEKGGSVTAAPEQVSSGKLRVGAETFRTIDTEEKFAELIKGIEKAKEFGFDLETTSLNPRAAEIVGIAICYDPKFGTYIPVGHRGPDLEQLDRAKVLKRLKPYLEDPKYKKIGQNLKYDWSVLIENGINPDGIGADTMVAAYVLQPEGRHSLSVLAPQYLDYEMMTYEQVCGKGKDQISFADVPIAQATRYSAEDAWIAVHLWKELSARLNQEKLVDVFAKIDMPVVDVLARIELQGVSVDVPWLKKLSKTYEGELAKIEERVGTYTKEPVNLNSPKQLAVLLFEELKLPPQGKTKTGLSTDASVLEALSPLHEVPRLLLEYREISKLKGTYVDPLPGLIDPKTGKIHASFHQAVAATGRLSSSDPNLQNIPIRTERGKQIRRAFIASPGNVLLAADYSQIELRILAHMSGDPELVRSFRENEDVHRRTAAEIFDVKPEKVDDRQRGIAKAINFGLMYGKTAFGLSQELGIPKREAQTVIDRYFERYNGVKRFLDQLILDARENGKTATLSGRMRKLPDLKSSNPALRGNAERMAMNTPIQGTAADLMKLAMCEIADALAEKKFESKLIIQVHDEVVLDCLKSEVEKVEKLVCKVMEGAMKLDVPLVVNSSTGENWMEI